MPIDHRRADAGTTSRFRRAAFAAIAVAIGGLFGAAAPAAAQTRAEAWMAAIYEQQEAIVSNRSQMARCGAPTDPKCQALVARGQQMNENLLRLQKQYRGMGGSSAAIAPARAMAGAPPAAPAPAAAPVSRVWFGGQAAAQPQGAVVASTRTDVPPGVGGARVATAPAGRMAPQAAPVAPAPAPQQPQSIFSLLFGGGHTQQQAAPPPPEPAPSRVIWRDPVTGEETVVVDGGDGQGNGGWGSNRTLCVRTCDGFYFPISFHASRSRFRTDGNVCKALCPGAETRLYYHANPGQEADQAVAADNGEPLTKLPNAFLYRTKVVDGCTCGRPDPRFLPAAAGGLLGDRRALAAAARVFEANELPVPKPRPAPDLDPESTALAISGFTPRPVEPLTAETAAQVPEVVAASEPPRVRTVGPKYFSDR